MSENKVIILGFVLLAIVGVIATTYESTHNHESCQHIHENDSTELVTDTIP